MKTKFDSEDENNKYYAQVFLDECLHELKMI